MRTCIVLCAIVALCSVQVTQGSDTNRALKNRVRGLTATASSIANNLIRVKDRLNSNVESKLAVAKEDYVREGNVNVAADLEAVRAAVEAAKAEGRNADDCLKSTRAVYDSLLAKVKEDIEKCIATSISIFEPALEQLKATIGVALNDVSELEAIIPECKSSNQMKERSCLLSSLTWATANVNNLKSTAVKVQQAGEATSAKALGKTHLCSSLKLDALRTDSIRQKQKALDCAKNAV